MYIPKIFEIRDQKLITDYIEKNGFGTLITCQDNRPIGTHVPMVIETKAENIILTGHLAVPNTQKKQFGGNQQALAIFSNHHAYISSSWYGHVNVPTWNYMAVHVYGTLHTQNKTELVESLHKMVDKYEDNRENRFEMSDLEPKDLERQLRGIMGFELHVSSLEASFKLSQNRNVSDHTNIIQKLKEQPDALSNAIADKMETYAKK